MEDKYYVEFKFFIHKGLKIEAFYPIKDNGCCDKDFFILTSNPCDRRPDGRNYSCQCGCGMWCTSGHSKAQDAIDEYRSMCRKYKEATKKRRKNNE